MRQCSTRRRIGAGAELSKPKREKAGIRRDILKAIRQVWPDRVVEINSEDCYFHQIYPELKRDLSRLKAATILFEREPEGGPPWSGESDSGEGPPERAGNPRSYHLFFISPADERFTFKTETEEPDEDDRLRVFSGQGRFGCSVGVSLVAPFAMVTLGMMEDFESGSRSEPDVELHIYSREGRRIDPEHYFRELLCVDELQVIERWRGKLAGILKSHGITVLPEEELRKPVPFLRGGEETFLAGQPITVKQAFFFEGL